MFTAQRHPESTPLWQWFLAGMIGALLMLAIQEHSQLRVSNMDTVGQRSECPEHDQRGRSLAGAALTPDGQAYRCVYFPAEKRRL